MNYSELSNLILEQVGGYKPVKLPYKFDALEPHIDEETMKLHFNKHYKGYIKKLNDAVTSTKTPLDKLIKVAGKRKDAVKNNAGGAFNHQIWWSMMTPDKHSIRGKIKEHIEKDFKTVENFYEKFIENSKTHFGSGWVWLVLKNNKLKIIQTDNQDNPLMYDMGDCILGIDVWEHAYYKKYGPDREKYIKNFLKVVNWDHCSALLEQALQPSDS
jgi:Fe-Mn family superoxide dismutase